MDEKDKEIEKLRQENERLKEVAREREEIKKLKEEIKKLKEEIKKLKEDSRIQQEDMSSFFSRVTGYARAADLEVRELSARIGSGGSWRQ